MQSDAAPLILFVPGLLPKPEPAMHRDALFRCLVAGIARRAPSVADAMREMPRCFDVVAWNFDFYRCHRDIGQDLAAIEAVIAQADATEADIVEAASPRRRLLRAVYRLGDLVPFLIPHLASEKIQVHLKDLKRYAKDVNGIAEHTRDMLRLPLVAAHESGRRVLLIGHSMGSVIAFETLWQLSRSHEPAPIDLFMSLGSPLGQDYVRRHMLGHGETGAARYPTNVGRWTNLTAVGDLTAVDPRLANDYGEMVELGLLDTIDDIEIFNYYRQDGALNVHAEYGYLVNKVTAGVVADWWRDAAG